jgi:AcrR family transcriptional regulator
MRAEKPSYGLFRRAERKGGFCFTPFFQHRRGVGKTSARAHAATSTDREKVIRIMANRRTGEEIRQHIVAAANQLIYERGFNDTTFSDIADASAVPRGNFYYYFKSKDEILRAVIEARTTRIRQTLADWETQNTDPKRRLRRFVDMVLSEEQAIVRFGCPMGTLNAELGKTQAELQQLAAGMFDLFLEWLKLQFQALGHGQRSHSLAQHMLAVVQGVALVAYASGDARFLRREMTQLKEWIDQL